MALPTRLAQASPTTRSSTLARFTTPQSRGFAPKAITPAPVTYTLAQHVSDNQSKGGNPIAPTLSTAGTSWATTTPLQTPNLAGSGQQTSYLEGAAWNAGAGGGYGPNVSPMSTPIGSQSTNPTGVGTIAGGMQLVPLLLIGIIVYLAFR